MPTTYALTSPVDATEILTECSILLRTIEHITYDLDRFSERIRRGDRNDTVVADIERHLAQARRNCAEASAVATTTRHRYAEGDDLPADVEQDHERLRDAFSLLALADSAYLRAFDVASKR